MAADAAADRAVVCAVCCTGPGALYPRPRRRAGGIDLRLAAGAGVGVQPFFSPLLCAVWCADFGSLLGAACRAHSAASFHPAAGYVWGLGEFAESARAGFWRADRGCAGYACTGRKPEPAPAAPFGNLAGVGHWPVAGVVDFPAQAGLGSAGSRAGGGAVRPGERAAGSGPADYFQCAGGFAGSAYRICRSDAGMDAPKYSFSIGFWV